MVGASQGERDTIQSALAKKKVLVGDETTHDFSFISTTRETDIVLQTRSFDLQILNPILIDVSTTTS